jgi:hypothetical protein
MNRKGFEMSLKAIAELILAAIIIIGTVVVFSKLYALFFASKVDAGTLNNFNRLASNGGVFELMLVTEGDVDPVQTSLMVKDGYVIVGFGADCSISENDANCPVSLCYNADVKATVHISKPRKCRLDAPCVCLFKDPDFGDLKNVPVECYSFNKGDDFVGKGSLNRGAPRPGQDASGEADLFLYGYCNIETPIMVKPGVGSHLTDTSTFGISLINISKSVVGNVSKIVVSAG